MNLRDNLRKIANFMANPPDYVRVAFDMEDYRSKRVSVPSDVSKDCGTLGCAVGWAPMIPGLEVLKSDEFWYDYRHRILPLLSDEDFSWMFDGLWKCTDNTPEGVSRRINHYLENGTPENARLQIYGEAPYLFADELEAAA